MYPRLLCLSAVVCALSAGAVVRADPSVPTLSWIQDFRSVSLFQWFTADVLSLGEYFPAAPPLPPCRIDPLPELTDSEALAFEFGGGADSAVQTGGLTPATARALTRFESLVATAGGTLILTSAYRPAAYQAHLQAVWDKWMIEMRDLQDVQCQELRSEVEREFRGHGLLETQRPATFSDHTLGTAFDAMVYFPAAGRRKVRGVNTDRLARRAGLYRPVRRQDPVHFRLVERKRPTGARVARVRSESRSS